MVGDQAGRLTRRSLLSGVVGVGMFSPPRMFASAGGRPGRDLPWPSATTTAEPYPLPKSAVTQGAGTGQQPGEPGPPPDPESGGGFDGLLGAGLLVHSREEWGARPPKRPARLLPNGPDHIVVHHTCTSNGTDLSLDQAFLLSRQIQAFHMDQRGWDDIGEQLTISRGGHVMEGRNRSLSAILAGRNVMGAQTLAQNEHTLGIESEGTYTAAAVPVTLWASLVEVCTWLCRVYDLDPQHAIVGHRDFVRTDCPGDVLYDRLPELRRAVIQSPLRRPSAREPG